MDHLPRETSLAIVRHHPFVGVYYFGDGLGENRSLRITPEGRFEFELYGCLGIYDCNSGDAEVFGGHLVLTPKKINLRRIGISLSMYGEFMLSKTIDLVDSMHEVNGDGRLDLADDLSELINGVRELASQFDSSGTPTDFIPVRWGERLFLVPESEGKTFCNCVNQGLFYVVPYRNFYLRQGDEKKKADGLPSVPEGWKPMLLTSPLQGKVIEVMGDGRARIDFGAENGAWKGMDLWIDSKFGWAEVMEVSARTCMIEVFRDEAWAKEGRVVRTRRPDPGQADE